MEGIVLLVLTVLVLTIVLPIAAFVRSSRASRRAEDAAERLTDFSIRLARMEADLMELHAREEGRAPAGQPAVRPEPTRTAAQPVVEPVVPEAQIRPAQPVRAPEAVPPPLWAISQTSAQPTPRTAAPPPIPPSITPGVKAVPETTHAPAPRRELPQLNWEQFIGIKLFMWVAGIALFLGVAFFLKHSFDRGWITPSLRVAMGIVTGLGLIVGGLRIRRDRYAVGVQVLTGAGVLILYASVFASSAFYHFIGNTAALLLMSLVTVTAFSLAVALNAPVVAVLGLLGGFLTPPLLSTGVDRPLGLFGYIALLDAGLVAVTLRKRWNYLVLLAAICTIIMQFAWVMKFLEAAKTQTGMTIFFAFAALFGIALFVADRRQQVTKEWSASALLMPAAGMAFALHLLITPYTAVCESPWVLFGYIFAVDAVVLGIAGLRRELRAAHVVGGLAVFLLLGVWTLEFLKPSLLNSGLALYLLMAMVHSVYPVVIERRRPANLPLWTPHLFAPLALLLVLIPIMKLSQMSTVVWPVVLIIDLLAIILAVVTFSVLGVLAVLLLTSVATAAWILNVPAVLTGLPEMLFIIGGFAVFFFAAGIWMSRRVPAREGSGTGSSVWTTPLSQLAVRPSPELTRDLITSLSALLPFLLLILVVARLPLRDPSPVFGLAALLLVLLFALVRLYATDWVLLAGFAGTAVLEFAWHNKHFHTGQPLTPLLWYLGFYLAFAVFPFLFQARFRDRLLPWGVAALFAPVQFLLVYRLIKAAYLNPYMGLVPAAFAILSLLSLVRLLRALPPEAARRNTQLAIFGGVTLFFITLIFPIQFEKQWITLGWALEGVALLWLRRRIPHPGLRYVALALLGAAFARLAMNPAVFEYAERTATPIFNWYLYTYGVAAICMFVASRLLQPPDHLLGKVNASAILQGLGTVLAFLLLNIEIADYFSTGRRVTFDFSGNFARDMTYSLAWGLFAFVLLVVGIRNRTAAPRYAGLALLVVTLLKLFLHDIWQLGGLYRIGSLIGLALVLIPVSFLYQRFLAPNATKPEDIQPEPSSRGGAA